MSEPRTPTGRKLAEWLAWAGARHAGVPLPSLVVAIEREAATPEPSDLRAAVEALRIDDTDGATRYGHGYNDAIRAVLALINAHEKGGPT